MIEACYALRGRARAIVLGGRVIVPLRDPAGDNARAGDVTIDRAELPVLLVSKRPLIARCGDATGRVASDAWRRVGRVPTALAQRLGDEVRRIGTERAAIARWQPGAPTERAVRM